MKKRTNKTKEEFIQVWITNGVFFGYPECCIKEFCEDFEKGIKLKRRNLKIQNKINRSGFIPCNFHKEKILENKTSLSNLIDYSKRKAKNKFEENWIES